MSTDTEHTSWDDLRAMLRALAQQSAETDRQIRELRLAGQETSAGMKDTDARIHDEMFELTTPSAPASATRRFCW
ncbi:MAG: hypothetical protein B7Y96_07365 [Comamonadaceae bacterium 32-67-11]|jgi:hypothetical protein|nr:MAG: hypothetical protein B7Y96_07365 [Comamonadaceae bacterium 32-67-11]